MIATTAIVRTPSPATLDGFTQMAADADGVDVRTLAPLTSLRVRTKNSVYHIIVTSRSAVIVQGGQFFPDPAAAQVGGATMGGSFVKLGWIGVGLCLELWTGDQRIITTRVRTIAVHRSPGESRPH